MKPFLFIIKWRWYSTLIDCYKFHCAFWEGKVYSEKKVRCTEQPAAAVMFFTFPLLSKARGFFKVCPTLYYSQLSQTSLRNSISCFWLQSSLEQSPHLAALCSVLMLWNVSSVVLWHLRSLYIQYLWNQLTLKMSAYATKNVTLCWKTRL